MPSVWIASYDEVTGIVTLNDGRTFNLNDVPGNGYNPNRLGKINERIQEQVDRRVLLTDLPLDDPDRTTDPNTPWMFWGDADGTKNPAGDWLISRTALVWLTYDGTNLIPHCSVVT